jgi:hypothetical protein
MSVNWVMMGPKRASEMIFMSGEGKVSVHS